MKRRAFLSFFSCLALAAARRGRAWLFAAMVAATIALLPLPVNAAVRSVDLKPFLGKSQFQTVNADWILPRGRQVVEGIPFQVDGVLELAGNSARFSNVGRTNVENIPIGTPFDRMYFLAAASRDVNEGVIIARLILRYVDNTTATVPIEYGRHVLDWMGPRHKGESPLIEPDARVAWQVQHSAAAKRDDSLRLFYMTLANPNPAKEVRSIDLVSARARGGLMVAAITVGSEIRDRPPDTLVKVEEHFHIEGNGEKPALTGRVTDEKGQPVAEAIVRVLSVKTVDTTDQLTPDDSSVVGRETRTDSDGQYRLEKLSERLLYRVMIISPKSQPAIFDNADPLAGTSDVRVVAGGGSAGDFMVQARVLGPDGKPVVGAGIKPDGVGVGGNTSWGGNNGFPNELVTGINGEFIMARDQPFNRLSVDIKAAGLAPAKVWLAVSNGIHTINLGVGATLTGRVMKDGAPMANVEMGVSGVNRNSEVFAGHYEVKTDADGRFRFEHLPPETEWWAYGLMRSLRRDGSIPPRSVRSGAHGESKDLGDISVQPGVTLAGKIQTRNGQSLPAGLRMNINLEGAWDNQSVRIDRNGTFEVTGLHTGVVEISINATAREWSLAGDNRSLDNYNPWRLTGLLERDKRDLLISIENKAPNYNNWFSNNGSLPDADRSNRRPLSGTEPSGPPAIVLAGTIVDEATGKPVPSGRITPGYKPPSASPVISGGGLLQSLIDATRPRVIPWNERPYWEVGRAQTFSDGRFSMAMRQLTSKPMLRIEADGYDVLDTSIYANSESNLTLKLKKGFGPKGVVLGLDGRPAADVTVVFASENEQFSMNTDGRLSTYDANRSMQTTKADGGFSFGTKSGGRRVFAANGTGFASVPVKNWPADGRIKLEPWSHATGALRAADGKPASNVQVAIEMNRSFEEGDPWMNFQERPMTDGAGKFSFQFVPPGEFRLVHLVPMNRGGWMHAFQTNAIVKGGATVDLGSMLITPSPVTY